VYLHTKCRKNFFLHRLTTGTPPSSRSRDTKTRTNSKNNPALSNFDIVLYSLRISGHFPAPVVNGGGDRPRKVQFSEILKPRDLDRDL